MASRLRLVADFDELEASNTTGHGPVDLLAYVQTQERAAKGSKHGDPRAIDIRVPGIDEPSAVTLSGLQVFVDELRVHAHDVGCQVAGVDDPGSFEFLLEELEVSAGAGTLQWFQNARQRQGQSNCRKRSGANMEPVAESG